MLVNNKMHMVEYEDYNSTALSYDKTRGVLGEAFISEELRKLVSSKEVISVLDAGCGTGNYSAQLSNQNVSMVGVDVNHKMISIASEKKKLKGHLVVSDVLQLPFKEHSFDAILINQVLHHLETRYPKTANSILSDTFPNVRKVASDFYKLLKHQGLLIINTSAQNQIRDGFWWAELIPKAIEEISLRFVPIKELCQILAGVGFKDIRCIVEYSEVLQRSDYLNPKGPLNSEWRAGDSTWALVSPEELCKTETLLTEMLRTGRIASFINNREITRRRIGQTTFILAESPVIEEEF